MISLTRSRFRPGTRRRASGTKLRTTRTPRRRRSRPAGTAASARRRRRRAPGSRRTRTRSASAGTPRNGGGRSPRKLRLELGDLGAREGRGHGLLRPLEEQVRDLDLLGTCTEARERVDEPLQLVSSARRSRPALARRAGSTCSRRRARGRPRGDTCRGSRAGARRRARRRSAAPWRHRRGRPLGARAPTRSTPRPGSGSARPPRRSRAGTQRGRALPAGRQRRRREVDVLEHRVHGAADLRPRQTPRRPTGATSSERMPATRSAK